MLPTFNVDLNNMNPQGLVYILNEDDVSLEIGDLLQLKDPGDPDLWWGKVVEISPDNRKIRLEMYEWGVVPMRKLVRFYYG